MSTDYSEDDREPADVSLQKKARYTFGALTHRSSLAPIIVYLSVITAFLEGIGVGFILPIIESARPTDSGEGGNTILQLFAHVYQLLDIPFELKFIIPGVGLLMVVRYTVSFIVDWLKITIKIQYVRSLQDRAFDNTLDAKVPYFDQQGSDKILNTIVTQAGQAGKCINLLIWININ